MRLIYLSSKHYPSATADGLFVAQAAKAMACLLGDEFVFVVARNDGPDDFLGVRTAVIGPKRNFFRTIWYLCRFPALRRYFTQGTVIYSNEQPLVLAALLWRPFFGYRVIYEAHGFFNWWRDRAFLRLWRWGIDGIVATSDTLRDLLVQLEPGLAGRVHVVRGGFDPAAIPADERAVVRSELGIPADRLVVGYAGHFKTCGEKGLSTLLEALTKLPAGQATALLVGGKPEEMDEYRKQYPNASCVFRGWMPDQGEVFRLLQAADVLIIPTSRDTLYTRYSFPMKAYDHLALGKPSIVSDVPIIREVMTDDVAVACKAGDVSGLASAIERLVADPELVARLGRNARAISGRYTWEQRARGILDIIERQ